MSTINEFSKAEIERAVILFLAETPIKSIASWLSMNGEDCAEVDVLMILRHEMGRMKEELGE